MVDLCAATKARILAAWRVSSICGPAQPLDDSLDVSKVDRVEVVVLHEQPWIGRDAHLSVIPVSLRSQGSRTSIQPLLQSNGGTKCSILCQFGQLLVAEEEIASELPKNVNWQQRWILQKACTRIDEHPCCLQAIFASITT